MSGPATLDHLRQYVTACVRKIGQGFTQADDDWIQVAFVQFPHGVEIIPIPMPLSGFSKTLVGEFLRRFVGQGAYRYAVLLNTHQAVAPTQEQLDAVHAETLRVEQIEGSRELLVLVLGDAEEEQVWMSEIVRRPRTAIRAPSRWERLDGELSGRFTGLNEYLR